MGINMDRRSSEISARKSAVVQGRADEHRATPARPAASRSGFPDTPPPTAMSRSGSNRSASAARSSAETPSPVPTRARSKMRMRCNPEARASAIKSSGEVERQSASARVIGCPARRSRLKTSSADVASILSSSGPRRVSVASTIDDAPEERSAHAVWTSRMPASTVRCNPMSAACSMKRRSGNAPASASRSAM